MRKLDYYTNNNVASKQEISTEHGKVNKRHFKQPHKTDDLNLTRTGDWRMNHSQSLWQTNRPDDGGMDGRTERDNCRVAQHATENLFSSIPLEIGDFVNEAEDFPNGLEVAERHRQI